MFNLSMTKTTNGPRGTPDRTGSRFHLLQLFENAWLESSQTRRKMPGDLCLVCGNYRKNNPSSIEAVKPHHKVCSRHFFNGDPKNGPQPHIGRQFASPIKKGSDRSARAIGRQQVRRIQELQSASSSASYGSGNSSTSRQVPQATCSSWC